MWRWKTINEKLGKNDSCFLSETVDYWAIFFGLNRTPLMTSSIFFETVHIWIYGNLPNFSFSWRLFTIKVFSSVLGVHLVSPELQSVNMDAVSSLCCSSVTCSFVFVFKFLLINTFVRIYILCFGVHCLTSTNDWNVLFQVA